MGVTLEEKAKAQLVVEESKRTARVDTGRLKRSINVKVQKGILVFRQYYYGIEDGNSKLVENAKKMMVDTPYVIELMDDEGGLRRLNV
nr:hypothetical protein [Flavobacterium sp.]